MRNYHCFQCNTRNPEDFYNIIHSLCKKCKIKRSCEHAINKKKKLVEYKGGQCERCGYNKCLASLCFHHRNPAIKDMKTNMICHLSIENAKREIDGCSLLCHNCHNEIHWCNVKDKNSWFD